MASIEIFTTEQPQYSVYLHLAEGVSALSYGHLVKPLSSLDKDQILCSILPSGID